MESIISTFHIDWKIIIAQGVNFGIVFAVLYIYAIKPLGKLMAERAETIKGGVDDAKANAAILEKTKAEYEKILLKARGEANDIYEKAKKEAEAKKNQMMEAAKVEVTGMIDQGKKALEVQKVKMVEDAKKEIVTLAMLSVRKLIEESPDGAHSQKAIKELDNL